MTTTQLRWQGRLLTRLRGGGDGDQGLAMLTVLFAMLLVTTVAVAALNFSAHAIASSRRAQDYRAALAAAEAGIDDYRRHLVTSPDGSYWKNGGVDASNAAFSPAGRHLPGDGADSAATYRYDVMTSVPDTFAHNLIRLKVTGTVNGVSRTVVADLNKPGFLKYGLFDMEETVDPAQYLDLGKTEGYEYWASRCGRAPTVYRYYYGTPESPKRDASCQNQDLYFGNTDIVNGPFHTNDAPMVDGHPKFKDRIAETSWPDCDPSKTATPTCSREAPGGYSNSSPDTTDGYPLIYGASLRMPVTNTAIKDETDPDKGGTGCLYTGPTKITLTADGKMTVLSPRTKSVNTGCGTATASQPMAAPQTVNLPANGVVYVQGIPTDPADRNYSDIPSCPTQVLGAYPQDGDNVTQTGAQKYDCHAGDLFVEGTLSGQLTMAAQNNIIITGDTTYKDGTSGTDVLGLVANQYVTIYHPVHCNVPVGGTIPTPASGAARSCQNLPVKDGKPLYGINVDAAILSVTHDFTVQNPSYAPFLSTASGTMTYRHVMGSVIESFGAFSSYGGLTGYSDFFEYDRRLLTLPPPYFLQPIAAPWELMKFTEVKNDSGA